DALADLAGPQSNEKAGPPAPRAPAAPPPGAAPAPDAGGAFRGLPGAPGVVWGAARHFRPPEPEIPTGSSGDPEAEWEALTGALEEVRTETRAARDSVAARAGDYSAAIFDAHLLFLDDEALLGPARRAILARSLGIPAAVGLGEALLRVPEGTELLLDGDAGIVHVEPAEELAAEYRERAAAREQSARAARAAAADPAVTRDGRRIEVVA